MWNRFYCNAYVFGSRERSLFVKRLFAQARKTKKWKVSACDRSPTLPHVCCQAGGISKENFSCYFHSYFFLFHVDRTDPIFLVRYYDYLRTFLFIEGTLCTQKSFRFWAYTTGTWIYTFNNHKPKMLCHEFKQNFIFKRERKFSVSLFISVNNYHKHTHTIALLLSRG